MMFFDKPNRLYVNYIDTQRKLYKIINLLIRQCFELLLQHDKRGHRDISDWKPVELSKKFIKFNLARQNEESCNIAPAFHQISCSWPYFLITFKLHARKVPDV